MNKNFLITIISCNRLLYLQNCIKSILEFAWFPEEAEYLIIDLGTVEDGIDSFLDECGKKGFICHRETQRYKNELYIGMNFAIVYAQKNDIPYVYFVQDDQQFVWHNSFLLSQCENIFESHPDIYQIVNEIPRKIHVIKDPEDLNLEFNIIDSIRYYLFNLIYRDTGIIRIFLYDKIKIYPDNVCTHTIYNNNRDVQTPSGELWMRNQIFEEHSYMEIASLRDGNTMMIPDTCVVRGHQRYGAYKQSKSYFYIDPLTEDQKNVLFSKKEFVFEDELLYHNLDVDDIFINTDIKKLLCDKIEGYPDEMLHTFPFVLPEHRKSNIKITKEKSGKYHIDH